jgi:Glyoxalase superfamily protein
MELLNVTPVLRIFDVSLARSFYVDCLGCTVD